MAPLSKPTSKLQDMVVTIWWHNFYLGTTIVFFFTTVLFAGLFGGYYSAWAHRSPCDNDQRWVFGSGDDFMDACHEVRADGLYAIAGKDCPSECDAWWHAKHPSTSSMRRLQSINQVLSAKIVTSPRLLLPPPPSPPSPPLPPPDQVDEYASG